MGVGLWILCGTGGFVVLVVIYDLLQTKKAILRNFPLIGHLRYILETVGPELRQYIVTSNDEERPFNRDHRRWIYASAKKQNNYFGFGSDNETELAPHHLVVKHSAFPVLGPAPGSAHYDPLYRIPCAKILGGPRGRKHAFRPNSVVYISGMSFGSLSAPAVEAINRGALAADCLHNTGEGGVSPHHQHGAELVWQIGTGYFGCRNEDGTFSMEKLIEVVSANKIRAIEIKLSQGAKPGLGGLLPAAKVTRTISRVRGIPRGKDCASPASHSAFSDIDSMLDFVESIAERTGLPVGIKSAVGQMDFWENLAGAMVDGKRGVDYIAIDGGEGGTGAAPLAFSDHVALPFKIAFARVYSVFARRGIENNVVWVGAGKLGFPVPALLAIAMGCDLVAVAREAMMAIGCIQAQRCHTGHCPAGIATQNAWLMRGLDPTDKAARLANYVVTLRKELLQLTRACGQEHPALVTLDHFDVVDDRFGSQPAREIFGYEDDWGHPDVEIAREAVAKLAAPAENS